MKLSHRWLSRHVDLTGIEPTQNLADLTMSTAEIEGLERFGDGLEPSRHRPGPGTAWWRRTGLERACAASGAGRRMLVGALRATGHGARAGKD